MHKRSIFILIICVGLVLFIIGTIVQNGLEEYEKSTNIPEGVLVLEIEEIVAYCEQRSGLNRDLCLFETSLVALNDEQYNNGTLCLQINSVGQEVTCLMTYAKHWNDTSICEHIAISDLKLSCFAVGSKDTAYCAKIQNNETRVSCMDTKS